MATTARPLARSRIDAVRYHDDPPTEHTSDAEDSIATSEPPLPYSIHSLTLLKCHTSNCSDYDRVIATPCSSGDPMYSFQAGKAFAHLAHNPLNRDLNRVYFRIHDPNSCTCTTWREEARSERPVIQQPTNSQTAPNIFNSIYFSQGHGRFQNALGQCLTADSVREAPMLLKDVLSPPAYEPPLYSTLDEEADFL
ncbi:hypothetical protein PMZ80_001760 [Knufia obscura]|uniref:Uncharacterized protein n=2 Tax=Knufia TaxID=430999 RepID=A0AAN8IAC3_9EURO|nr:hypothetical protein PMZ80_001760 [Knufia obscura]KAK5955415.1 hypothetical protein OHC33_003053 [Knufia fluminis]